MNIIFDAIAPAWAHAFATRLNAILGRNDAKLKDLETRIKALEAK